MSYVNQHMGMLKKIIDNVEKVIIGKREVIELIVCSFICNGHVLIEDVPGVGKTSLASALAKSMDCSFRRIQFTPDVLPSDITGFSMYNQKKNEFEYREGVIMSQIILADEINRATPKAQSSLLEVMEENQVTVDGRTYPVPRPFIVLATQNPVEYLGTYPLPEAQLDRFFMKVYIGYPDAKEESDLLTKFGGRSPLKDLRPVAAAEDILEMQEALSGVFTDKRIKDYIVNIVRETRRDENIMLGGSPRASLCLHRAAQAWAFYLGRDYIIPDDVIKMSSPVLEHRIFLKQDAKLRKVTTSAVINNILSKIKVPTG